MNNPKIYRARIKLKSPTLITQDSSSQVLRNSVEVLPGSVIRGAILTRLYNNGFDIEAENKNPTLIFHPAYPLANEIETRPAHPFIYKCKICEEITDMLDQLRSLHFNTRTFLQNIDRCNNGHMFSLKSIGGRLVYRDKKGFREFTTEKVGLTSVATNKLLKSSERSMLYRYVCLDRDSLFSGLITDLSDTLAKQGLVGNTEVSIGRGGSRGFGLANISIDDVTERYLKEREEHIKNEIAYGNPILVALSPVFSIREFELSPLPNLGEVDHWLTDIQQVSGFSLLTGLPKLRVNSAHLGSLFLLGPSEAEYLLKLEMMGSGDFSFIGFNHFEVMGHE